MGVRELYEKRKEEEKQEGKSSSNSGVRHLYTVKNLDKIGQSITNRVNTYLENHNSYINDYQNRYSNRKGNYEDAYVSDSADWYSTVSKRNIGFDTEVNSILSYIDQYKDYLDADWVKSVKEALTGTREQQKAIYDIADNDNKYWSSFGTDDLVQAYGSAEEAYKYRQRDYGYRQKHDGKTSTELQALIDSMEDGEEKEWLKTYEDQVGYNELLSPTDKTSANYDPDFYKYVSAGKEYLYMDDAEYNRRIAEYDDMYFNADTNEERQVALAGMNALKYQYNNIKRTAPNFEGLNDREREVYLYYLGKDLETGTMDFSDTFYEELTGRKNNAASNKTLDYFKNFVQKPKALEDGFDWYDALLIPLGTLADIGVGLVKGAANTFEGIVDYAGYGVAGAADILGADGFADTVRGGMRWNATDALLGGVSDYVDQASISGRSFDMIAEGIGQVLSVGKVTKAGQAALNLGKVGTTVLSSLLMFSSSAGLGITEAYESGKNVTDAEAFAYGTMAGVAEAVSELLWGGAGKLSNKLGIAGSQIGLDELVSKNVSKVFSSTFGRNFAQYMIGAGFEGVEGLASGFMQAVAKRLTYLSDEKLSDIIADENLMEQFLTEALTSFFVQAPDFISKTNSGRGMVSGLTDDESFLLDTEFDSYLQESKAEGYELNDKQKDEIYEKTKNIINQLGEVSYKEAKKATKDAKKEARKSGIPSSSINPTRAESLTKDEVRGLLAANDPLLADEYMKKLQTTAEERLKALGQTEDVSKLAELAAKYATRQKLSKADKAFLANNKNGNRVANELRFMGNPSTYKSLSDRIDENESVSVSDNGKATVNGEEINIDKKVEVVDFIRDKETGKITDTIINADGKEVKASEIEYADEDQAYLFSAVKHIENITPADATAFVRGYDSSLGISVGEYLNGIDEAYTYGYHGYTEADMKSGLFTTKLSDEKAKGAYEIGKLARKSSVYDKDAAIKRMRTAVEAETAKVVAEGKPAPEPKKMAITYNGGNGVVTDFENTGMKLSKKQRAGVEVAKILHKLGLGTNFEFFESFVSNNKRVFINDAGVEKPAPAGVYMRSDGTIRIDLNAYNGRGLTLYTLAHELTHFIQQWSTEKYEVLAEYLVSTYEKTGITMHQRVLREQARLKGIRGENISYNEAYDEVVANAMMKMFDDGNLVQRLTELKAKDKNLVMKLWEGIKKTLNKLLNVYQKDPGVFNDTKDLMQMKEDFEVLQGMFAEALVESSENFQAAQTIGFEMDMGTESVSPAVMHSEQTWTESDYVQQRDNAAKEIAKAIGVTVKKAKDYIDSVNSIAKMIAEDRSRLDYFSSPGRTSFVDNAEYGGSFDFSTLCKKRRLLTGTFTAIQKALPNTALTADEILDIRNRMKEAGLEVSCGLCYVEGSRANMGQFAKEFLRLYKQYYPDAWQPNMADVNTPDGIEWVRINHPECYEQYEYFWNHYGTLKDGDKNLFASQQKPKLYQLHTEYKGEILNKFKNDDKVEDKNLNGGIRLQSFSDFEIVHLIDTMQIIMDMSRVGLAGQAYTKVPDFAWALGDTGLKINLSLIAKGVDENGKLIFDDVEGMPIADAMKLRDRYSKNVGTILVAFNDAQLLAAMADERVDFIIPFHRSQWKKSQYEAMGLPAKTKDYTFMQNEKFIKPTYHEYRGRMVKDKASNYMPNEYWDFSKSGKENAEAYLEMCARNNKRPKFYKLLTDNGNGSYSLKADGSTDGYWKLLIDFKMYDNDGNGSPQMAVKPDFNMEEATRMLDDYSGGHSNFPVAQGIVDDFVKDYKANHKSEQYSSQQTDADYMDAVNRGDMETVQKLVDEAAKTAGYTAKVYHGTQKFGFTKIDTKKSDDGISFFAADDLAVAGSYANIIDPDARGINEKKGSISKKTVLKLRDQVKDIASEYLQKYTEILGYYDHWHMDHLESTKKAEWVKNQSQLPVFTAKAINAMATIHDDMMGAIDKAQTSNKKYPAISEETRQKLSDLKDEYIKKASGVISPFQDTGVYGLYANTDNHLVIDAQGGWWSDIKSDQLPAKDGAWNTRDVAKYAKENGYSGVTFKNLIDPANRTVRHPATVYVFFDPKSQLKSADPVTYTKLGRVIPLSKRFNAKNSDIRFSSQETDLDTETDSAYDGGKKKTEQEDKANGRRKETREDFHRRAVQEGCTVNDRGEIAYAFRPVADWNLSENIRIAKRNLREKGIQVIVCDLFEVNRDSITSKRMNATTDAGEAVYLHTTMETDPIETAEHEAYHFWKHTQARMDYFAELYKNFDFDSPAATDLLREIEKAYIESKKADAEIDVEVESDESVKLIEEAFAYVTGFAASGDQLGIAHKILRDYDSVKDAWDDLIKKQSKNARYSSQETDADYMDAINRGDMETAQRMVDEAAKKAGYTEKAYHGTSSFGFTKFDPAMSDDKSTLFFTDDIGIASTYAGKDVRKVKNIADAKSFKYEKGKKYTEEELKEAHDFIQAKYHVYGLTKIDVEKQTLTHAGTRYSAKQLMETADHISKEGIYGVYLNTDNVLEVDAGYSGWSMLKNPEVNEWKWRIKYKGEGDFNYFKANADDQFQLELVKNGEAVHNGAITFHEMHSMLRKAIGSNRTEMAIRHATDGSDIGSSRFDVAYSDDNGFYVKPTMTTREFAAYAKKKGYDGVKIKDLYDWGNKNLPAVAKMAVDKKGAATIYILFDSNRVKSADPVTYDESGNVIPLSKRFNSGNDDIRFSTQETDNISNRDMLANAFETLAQNSEEYKMIQKYKNHIRLLNEYEDKLSKLNAEIYKMTFGNDGNRDYKRLRELQAKAKETAGHINRHDKELLNLEASEPLRKVIEQERKKEAQKTREHIGEILQNKKARAEQTEYRHKIRKVVRDLDKILKNGNKKQNVKEDMKGFVSKALELADYLFQDHVSNDDLIRKGITVPMRGNEAKLVKETEEILNKLYDEADSLTDEEFTRLDAKRKRNLEKLRDLLTEQRNERLRTPVYKLFDDLVTEYASLKNSNQESVKAAYDPNVERFLRSYIGETNGETDSDRKTLLQNMRVADMTTDELWKLYNAYTMVLKSVRDANKLHVKGRTESIEQMVTQIVTDFGKRNIPDKKLAIVARNIANKIGWDYEKLHYALDRIGSNAFTELIMNLADSENIVMRDVIEAAEFRDQIVEKYGFNDWDVNKEIDKEFLDNTGKKFKLTLGQLMSLYAYSRRDGAWDHIEYGGFVFGEKALTNPKPADSYKLSKEQCMAITNTLTKEQKAYVEDMQKFLSETMGAKGNEVSMELYGIKMFGEKNYFPIHIAGQFKAQAQESQAKQAAGFGSMSNAGFTHAQNPNAKAPFVLEAFNDVWADHVNEMSRYHGTVPALEDIRRVMNRSSYSESTAESTSVKAMMENYFGKEAVDYFDNLYREANSGAIRDKLDAKSQKLLSLFRKGSVAYSFSVLIQQPASIVRAYAMINKKYFGIHGFGTITSGVVKTVADKLTKTQTKAYNEMLKYAPGVTMAKEIGGFDTATGGSIRSYLLDTNKSFIQSMKTENLKGKGKALMNKVDDNAIANLPNVADKIAWIEIWNACKRETAANHKDLATSSDEFMQIVGERFTEVIRATQVYDSIFAKSPMLKSKSLAVQYLVSFMNEPNTVANMAESSVRDATRGNWKSGARKAVSVIYSIIFTDILKSLVYAMRDDDEDETYIEKYIEAFTSSLMDDFNALNYIPLVRDAWSVAQGYDVERADMAIVSDAVSALGNVIKNATKDTDGMTEDELVEFDKKVTEAKWKLVESLAGFFGIPAKNIRREINGVIDHARIASANAGQTTAMSAWDKVRDAVIDSIPFMSNDKTKNDKLYSAIVNGDTAYVDRMKDTYKTEDAYHKAVRTALRESDPRIKEAALAEINGNPSERVRIARLIIADGFVQDDVVAAINSEINALTPKEEDSGTDKKKGFYTTDNLVREFANGDTTSAKAAKSDIISTAIANGKTKEQAEKDFMSSVSSSAKEAYENNWLSESKAKKLLVEYAGEDEEGATSKVNYWTLCKMYPKYKDLLNESRTEKYHEYVKPAGISMDMYAQFLTKTNGLATKYDKWGDVEVSERDQVLDVIDSLSITRRQKNALYLAAGYAESGLNDVPW